MTENAKINSLMNSRVSSVLVLWSGILVHFTLVDFDMSLIELMSTNLRVHIFTLLVGLVIASVLEELDKSDLSGKIFVSGLASLLTILLFGLITIINSEISGMILMYVGIGFSINSYWIYKRN